MPRVRDTRGRAARVMNRPRPSRRARALRSAPGPSPQPSARLAVTRRLDSRSPSSAIAVRTRWVRTVNRKDADSVSGPPRFTAGFAGLALRALRRIPPPRCASMTARPSGVRRQAFAKPLV